MDRCAHSAEFPKRIAGFLRRFIMRLVGFIPSRLLAIGLASMKLGMQHIKIMTKPIARIIQRAAKMAIGIIVNQADGDLGQP